MNDLDEKDRQWLANKFTGAPHGAKQAAAKAAGISSTMLSRIINPTGKEPRTIKSQELRAFAAYFNDTPPSLIGIVAREVPPPPERQAIVRVPLLDRVSAGKLRQPLSQIPMEDVPLLAFADLGKGDFIALTVEGDSMDRIAPDGATIIIDKTDTTLISNKPYVVADRGEVSFKLWKPNPPRFAPSSTNPSHEPIFVKTKEVAERMVVGRVKRAVVDL